VRVPTVYAVDVHTNTIVMECVDGPTVKAWLRAYPLPAAAEGRPALPLAPAHAALARAMGHNVALLHTHHIIHGDLTTSNMLVVNGDDAATDTAAPVVVRRRASAVHQVCAG
jgi:TP53 regulating kinase and related kinases